MERTRIAERRECATDRVVRHVFSYHGYVTASELEHTASQRGYLPSPGIAARSHPSHFKGLRLYTSSPTGEAGSGEQCVSFPLMLLDWTGRGTSTAWTSAGRFRITCPQSWTGWGSIDRTGWKLCAASADFSSRRRGDRARSSMRRRAARGAGSRARRRLEPPLCRPLARRRPVKQTSPLRVPQGAWPPRALNSLPGPSRHRQANRSTSHFKRSRTKTTVVSIRSASDRLETQRLDAQVDCSYRRFLGCLDSSTFGSSKGSKLPILWITLCLTNRFSRLDVYLRPLVFAGNSFEHSPRNQRAPFMRREQTRRRKTSSDRRRPCPLQMD